MSAALAEQRLDAVFGALSHRTRRALLQRLGEGPASVTALAEPMPMTLAAVSKHLRVLEGAGLVRRRRRGREHLMSLSPAALDGAAAWITEHRALWQSRLAALDRLLQEQDETQEPRP